MCNYKFCIVIYPFINYNQNMSNDLKQLQKQVEKLKNQGELIDLISGCFDVLHVGHIHLFKMAKKSVDFLVVAIENDATISMSKNNRPINSLKSRLEFLEGLKYVDYAVVIDEVWNFEDATKGDLIYKDLIKRIRPDYIITDINTDKYCKEKEKRAKDMGIKFLGLNATKQVSTTKIAESIINQGL